MGFYLHLVDDHPKQRQFVPTLLDREGIPATATAIGFATAIVALLWQWGALQAIWATFVGA